MRVIVAASKVIQFCRACALVVIALAALMPAALAAPTVSLAWDPSPDADVTNYRLYWGPGSGNYNGSSDLGNVTNTVFTQLVPGGHYYFVVTAINAGGAESDPSNEIDYLVPGSNTLPTITAIADVSTAAGTATAAQPFTVGDVETAAGSLSVSAASSNPALIPAGNIAFGGSGASRSVTATPASGQSGTSTITVTVSDGQGGSASDSFVVTVSAPANTAPTITSLANQTTPEDTATATLAFTVGDTQTAVGSLTVTAGSSNPTLVPVANVVLGGSGASRTVRVVPATNQSGAATITLTVSDAGGLTANTSFTVTVSAVNDLPTITAIADVSTAAGTVTAAQPFTVGDVETAAGSLSLSAASSNPALIPAGNIAFGGSGASRSVTATPASGQSGTSTITVTVSDGQGGSASDSFVVTVSAPANTAPTITSLANQTTPEDTATATLAFTVGDTQTAVGSLTVTAGSSNPTLVPAANVVLGGSGASRTVRVVPATNQSGAATITLTVSDAGGLTANTSFTVTVSAVNDLPTITAIADVSTAAGTATAAQPFTVGDVETAAGSLSVSAASSNPALIPAGNIAFGGSGASRSVTATPASGQSGTSTITVTVSDGQGGSASDSFVVTVSAPANTAPTITAVANQTTPEDTATATLAFTVGDTQTAVGSLTVTAGSSNPTLVPAANVVLGGSGASRTVRVVPATNQSGAATITLTVSDAGGLTASRSFTVTVSAVNDLPTITAIADVATAAGTATAAQPFTVGDVETAAGSLSLSAASSNPALIPVGNIVFGGSGASRSVTATPASGQSGTSTITVTVSDGQGGSASRSFAVIVSPPTNTTSGNFVAYWAFDEPSGLTALESANHRDGVLSTGIARTTGVSGGALLFDGVTSVVNVSSASDLSPGTNLTMSLWFKPSVLLDGSSGRRELVKKPLSFGLMFNYPGADGRLTFALNSGLPKVHSTTAAWRPDRWYHVAVTYDGASLRLYVNGALEGTAPATIPAGANSNRVQIGGSTDQAESYCFAGVLDEVRFYQQPLSASEVVALFDSFKNAANAAPTISELADESTEQGATPITVSFVVEDNESPAANLILSGESSNPALVPNTGIVFGGSGANRTITVIPVAGQLGETVITLSVSDGARTAQRSFRCTVVNNTPPNVLALATVGEGVVTPNLSGRALVVGRSYTFTAKPASGYLFAGWEGATNCTRTALAIVMRTNLHLVAKFVRNPFLPVIGQFNGLFHEADEVRHDTSGRFQLTLGSTGTYSARLINGSRVHAWTGRFALDSRATNVIRRVSSLGNLTVMIGLDAASNLITGSVTAPTWQAALTADRAGNWTATNPSPYAARYTALLPSGGDGIQRPSGTGYSVGTISTNGLTVLATALPDGRMVTVSPRVSRNGQFPFYAWVLGGRGSVLGWVNFADRASDDFSGLLSWSRPYYSGTKFYPAGFTNDLPIVGARYVAPKSTNAIMQFTTGQFAVHGGNLVPDIVNEVLLQPPAKVLNLSSNALKVTFTTTTGKFIGTVKDPASSRLISFKGVALQKGDAGNGYAEGFFNGTNQFGGVSLGR